MQRFFKNNPILILAFPLMLGIAVSWLCGIQLLAGAVFMSLSFVALVVALLWQGSARWLFGAVLAVAFFALGVFCEVLDRRSLDGRWSGAKGCFEAVLLEAPHVGGKAARVKARVTRQGRDSIAEARREGLVYLYFENSVELEVLTVGDKLFFEGAVQPPHNAHNPAEFDVEHYMYVNGISGTAYLNSNCWALRGSAPLSLSMRAMLLREKIVNAYSSLGLSSQSQGILSALTVGERRDLSSGVRNLYAAVGASHVLALSGLHLGILYMFTTLLLPVAKGRRWLMVVREFFVLLILWGFAAVAGLTASVVRAAMLFTLISLARCMQRDSSSVNSLAFAAIVMLVVNPRWLFDVGFQLSFAAVLSILIIVPIIDKWLDTYNRGAVLRYLLGLLAVSVAAQIGTLPLIWYYFGTFPLYFLGTNIVVVPAAFLIMSLAVVLLLLFPFETLRGCVAFALDNIITAVNSVLRVIEALPASSVELPYIEAWAVFVIAAALVAVLYAVVNRKWRFMAVAVVVALPLVGHLLYIQLRTVRPHIIFYNSNDFSAVQLVASRNSSYLVSSYPRSGIDEQYVVAPYCRREHISTPLLLPDCCYNDYYSEGATIVNGLVTFGGRRIKIVADDLWRNDSYIQPVDCILLCRGFVGSIEELLLRYPTRYILMDATLYAGSCKRVARECKEQGVRCVDLRKSGARKMLVRGTGVRIISVD